MNRLEQRPAVLATPASADPLLLDPPMPFIDLIDADDDDDLSSVRGLVAGITLSVPVWAGLGYLAWKVLH